METVKKILYYLVLPLILIFIVLKGLAGGDLKEAIESLINAIKRDDADSKKQNDLVKRSDKLKTESDSLKRETDREETDENWNKRKK